MPLNFGGQKRSGAFDTVWSSARVVADNVLIDWRRCGAPGAESRGEMLRKAPRAGGESGGQLLVAGLGKAGARAAASSGEGGGEAEEKADSTLRCSQAVPHPSTNQALCRLISEVRRDPVHSARYGRQRKPMYLQNRSSPYTGGFRRSLASFGEEGAREGGQGSTQKPGVLGSSAQHYY